jgi:phosphoglycerate-specific signal transduction histidine kinase
MSIFRRNGVGKVLAIVGDIGFMIGAGLTLYTSFNKNEPAESRYNQVMQLSERVTECQAESQLCSELREKYENLTAQANTPKLMAEHINYQNNFQNYLTVFVGAMFLSQFGQKLTEREKVKELKQKLAEANKKLEYQL